MPPKKESEKKIYTESDLKKAYEFGANYTKGTLAQAQDFTFERLLVLLKITERF
jgi:hypothetical protein